MSKSVQITVMYECGRCGNAVRKVLGSTPDGLIEIPNVYCGRCVGHKHLSSMSCTMSQEKLIETPDKPATQERFLGRDEVSEGGRDTAPVGSKEGGRVAAGETGREDGSTGERDSGGMPTVVKNPPPKGKSA